MAYKYYTITEIYDWYKNNVSTAISISLLRHMEECGIILRLPNKRFSLSEVNNYLLQKEDCNYIKNNNGKFLLKENRITLLDKFKDNQILNKQGKNKFIITKLEGNKLKLVKL